MVEKPTRVRQPVLTAPPDASPGAADSYATAGRAGPSDKQQWTP